MVHAGQHDIRKVIFCMREATAGSPANMLCFWQYLNAPYNTSPTQLRIRLLLALQD